MFQFGALTTTGFKFLNTSDSKRAVALLAERLDRPADFNEVVIVRSSTLTVHMPRYRRHVEGLQAKILELGRSVVSGTSTFHGTGNHTLVSDDRHTTLIPIATAGKFNDAKANVPKVRDILDAGLLML